MKQPKISLLGEEYLVTSIDFNKETGKLSTIAYESAEDSIKDVYQGDVIIPSEFETHVLVPSLEELFVIS